MAPNSVPILSHGHSPTGTPRGIIFHQKVERWQARECGRTRFKGRQDPHSSLDKHHLCFGEAQKVRLSSGMWVLPIESSTRKLGGGMGAANARLGHLMLTGYQSKHRRDLCLRGGRTLLRQVIGSPPSCLTLLPSGQNPTRMLMDHGCVF